MENNSYNNDKTKTLSDNNFLLPDMGDYLDNEILQQISKKIIEEGHADPIFYLENPFTLNNGYHPAENVFVFSATPQDLNTQMNMGILDGDTVYFDFNSVSTDDNPFSIDDKKYNNVKDYLSKHREFGTPDVDRIGLRLLGFDAPEIIHYSVMPKNNLSQKAYISRRKLLDAYKQGPTTQVTINKKKYPISAIAFKLQDSDDDVELLITNVSKKDLKDVDETKATFIYEIDENKENNYKVVVKDGTNINIKGYREDAEKAKSIVNECLKKAKDTKIIIDRTILNRTKNEVPEEYKNMYDYDLIKATYNPFYTISKVYEFLFGDAAPSQINYQDFGKDIYNRLLGSLYVKMDVNGKDLWVNVGKKVLAETEYSKVLPQFGKSPSEIDKFGNASDVFRLWSYDKDNYVNVDAWEELEEARRDDRKKIQKEITGIDLENLKEYTCLIGDCLFIVPPTSIRSISTSVNEKIPLMRSKNSSVKSIPKSIREIEIDLFFNDSRGINGIPYEQRTPSGSKETYYMNGLRALIAQFKFTPYLPIENNYINKTLNIEAVCLKDFMITTVPNFPNTLQAKIVLKEFNYRHYMPELPVPDIEKGQDLYTNMFATTINFPVMRYYYQKSIQEGQRLHDYDFLSEEYITSTFGGKTALQPMDFTNQSLKIYLANEEHLKQKQQLKEKLKSLPVNRTFKPTDDIIEWLNQMSLAFQSFNNLIDKDFKNFNNKISNNKDKIAPFVPFDKKEVVEISPEEYPLFLIDKKYQNELINGGIFSSKTDKYRRSFYNEEIVPLLNSITKAFKSNPAIQYVKLLQSSKAKPGVILTFEIKVNTDIITNITNYELMKKYIAKILGINVKDVLKNDVFYIDFSSKSKDYKINVDKENVANYATIPVAYGFDLKMENDYKVFAILTQIAGDKKIKLDGNTENTVNMLFQGSNINDELERLKNALDLETLDSLRFDEYPIGFPLISNISCSYSNLFAGISLQAVDGEAPQYLGGSDINLEINMTTKDDFTVNQFYALQRVCVQRLLDYKLVMTCSPIKIDSEFTRMLGINEILIEDVDIQTVPSFPGLKQISLKVSSVDRTIRNREALKKIEKDESLETVHSQTIQTKNILQLNDTLSKVDLYPDLELPTVLELDKRGFTFIKYNNEYGRKYVDPDFYFVYGHVYSSSMLRKSIVAYFSDPDNAEKMFELNGGGEIKDTVFFKAYHASKVKAGNTRFTYSKSGDINTEELSFNDIMKRNEKYIKSLIGSSEVYENNKDTLTGEIGKQLYKVENIMDIMSEFNEVLSIAAGSHACITSKIKIALNDEDISDSYKNYKKAVEEKRDKDIVNVKNEIKDILKNPINDSSIQNVFKLTSFVDHSIINFIDTNSAMNEFGRENIKSTMWYKYGNFIKHIGRLFDLDNSKIDYKTISDIIICSMTAMTGNAPLYIDKQDNLDFSATSQLALPKLNNQIMNEDNKVEVLPYILAPDHGQGESTLNQISDIKDAKNGVIFGPYGIKKYHSSYVQKFYNKPITNKELVFLDPYYNKEISEQFLKDNSWSNSRLDEYIECCSNSLSGASHAFFRLMLLNLYKLLNDRVYFPICLYMFDEINKLIDEFDKYDDSVFDNIADFFDGFDFNDDILKLVKQVKNNEKTSESKEESKEEKKQDKEDKKNDENKHEDKTVVKEYDDLNLSYVSEKDLIKKKNALISRFKSMIKKIKADDMAKLKAQFINGMFALIAYMTLEDLDGDKSIYRFAREGKVGEIESYLTSLAAKDGTSNLNANEKRFHLLTASLLGEYKETRNKNYSSIEDMATSNKHSRIYLEAADDPLTWICHSYYDMVMNDYRGRMLRAFPTYYMLLIDEGREFGFWKLHDNFYNMNSITSIDVTKSRKIAADTAIISMTNLYGTYTTEDEDIKDEENVSFKEVFLSVFSPRATAKTQEQIRINSREINRAQIVAGTRINLRLGYGSNASRLPTVFNGNVAEVQPGEMITLIAQGDGVEISNNAMFNAIDSEYIEDIQYDEEIKGKRGMQKWIHNKITPREMLLSPLIYEGKWGDLFVRDVTKGLLKNQNPFGIYHFGDRYFTKIFKDCGEVGQNIYEALSKPSWSDDIPPYTTESHYALIDAPRLRTSIHDKSYWDLMHMCASVSPDFVTSIVPFGLRSSIFYGHPRYYYAYDYAKNNKGELIEKRKPFQQFHIATSYGDIISNSITATSKNLRTCATGHYKGKGRLANKAKSVGPMFVDVDIYPEFQKMMTVDCGFEYTGAGAPFTIWGVDHYKDEHSSEGGYQLAWRSTAHALKNSVKDMYSGMLTIMGTSSIKPYDKVTVHDVYENMSGNIEVESVVHRLAPDTGFTTTIVPDCIASIDDRYEQIADLNLSEMLKPVLLMHSITCISLGKFLNSTKPQLLSISHALKNLGSGAQQQIQKLTKTIGKEEISTHLDLIDKMHSAIDKGFGLTDYDTAMYSLFHDILKNKNKLVKFDIADIKNQKDILHLLNQLDSLDDTIDNLNPIAFADNFKKEIESLKSFNAESYNKNKEALEDILKNLQSTKVDIDIDKISFNKKNIADLVHAVPKEKIDEIEDLAKTVKELESFLNSTGENISYKDLQKQLKNLKNASIYIDDVKKIEGFTKDTISNIDNVRDAYKVYDNIEDTYKTISKFKTNKILNPFISNIVGQLAFMLLEFAMVKDAQTYIERYLQNMQVLTIHPIMRNGYVYTAGLNGHKGIVVGSPTYNQIGFFEEYAMKIFGATPMNNTCGKIFKFVLDMFFTTDKMREIVETYKKDNSYGVPLALKNEETQYVDFQNKLANNIAYYQTKEFSIYKAMFLKNRIKSAGTVEWDRAYLNSRITGIEDVENTLQIDENLDLITNMDKVKFLKEHGALFFATELAKENRDNSLIKEVNILKKSGGCYKMLSYFDIQNNIWDIPMLRPDACIVLNILVDKIAKIIEPSIYEPGCDYENINKHPIIFHNGTRINDEWYSTGYCFSIEVKDYDKFGNIIEEMEKEQDAFSKNGCKVFSCQKHQSKNNCYKFFVHAEIK